MTEADYKPRHPITQDKEERRHEMSSSDVEDDNEWTVCPYQRYFARATGEHVPDDWRERVVLKEQFSNYDVNTSTISKNMSLPRIDMLRRSCDSPAANNSGQSSGKSSCLSRMSMVDDENNCNFGSEDITPVSQDLVSQFKRGSYAFNMLDVITDIAHGEKSAKTLDQTFKTTVLLKSAQLPTQSKTVPMGNPFANLGAPKQEGLNRKPTKLAMAGIKLNTAVCL